MIMLKSVKEAQEKARKEAAEAEGGGDVFIVKKEGRV
jgi:hypothetical protein